MEMNIERKEKLVTYDDICEMAFEPTVDLMMKKYDVLSMTNEQLGNAFQEVRDAVKLESEEFVGEYEKVIKKLKKRYIKVNQYDMDSDPKVIKEKKTADEKQKLIELKEQFKSVKIELPFY